MDYYLQIDNATVGPITEDEVVRRLEDAELDPSTLAWHEGQEDWVSLTELFDIEDEIDDAPPPDLPSEPTVADSYLVAKNGTSRGPYTVLELHALVAAGGLRSDALVWTEGMTGWAPLHQTLPDFPPPPPTIPKVVARTRLIQAPGRDRPIPENVLAMMREKAQVELKVAEQNFHRPRPFLRLIARMLDGCVIAPVSTIVWALLVKHIVPQQVLSITTVKEALLMHNLAWLVSALALLLALPILVETIILSATGTSLFKYAFGLEVVNEHSKKPSLIASFLRSFKVFVYGLGCQIPLINLAALIISYNYLGAHGQTSWEDSLGLEMKRVRRSLGRALGDFCLVVAFAAIVMAVLLWKRESIINATRFFPS